MASKLPTITKGIIVTDRKNINILIFAGKNLSDVKTFQLSSKYEICIRTNVIILNSFSNSNEKNFKHNLFNLSIYYYTIYILYFVQCTYEFILRAVLSTMIDCRCTLT